MTLFAGCSNPPKLLEKEKVYGTSSDKYAIFHRIAEADRGFGLKYPGFLVGIEKGHREDIDPNNTYNVVEQLNRGVTSEKNYERVKDILGDRKLTFISHIAQYRLKSSTTENPYQGIPYIEEEFIHNAYEKDYDHTKVYSDSDVVLGKLKERLGEIKNSERYTHIFLYCMGWNTDQQECLRNYNSLLALMIENYAGREPFRPLFVGISWPSLWKWKVFKYTGIISSYFAKADDADEVGLVWANRVLRDILVPLKREKEIPLIIVGHSLGSRALTRALFSAPLVPTVLVDSSDDIKKSDIDLVIGLEGAFSVRRFLKGKGLEGYPYEKFADYARKFVFTWSSHDTATEAPVIYGTRYIGSESGYNYTSKFDSFEHFKINVEEIDQASAVKGQRDKKKKKYKLDINYNRIFKDVQDSMKWKNSFTDASKISIVDASELIYYHPYQKGGNAHNDIYTPGVADFIWSCIDNIP
ncbi:hypothetical protein SCALIN_C02_0014 [Candidatus Scalindua japonica]|uniref:Alpha/beta hydrolase n=2 Tax=Candidatus Scalindua japonica TaxID=1284222 RepID=A0A286TTZ9_9BACT|nr:hypothetical protein SCALIN_C02_0014 [Candidatus Scalindua japonica]